MSFLFGKTPLATTNQNRAAEFERQRAQWLEDCYTAIRDEADRRSSREAAKGKHTLDIDLQDFKYPEVYSSEFKDLLILTKSDLSREDIKGIKNRIEEWAKEQGFVYSSPEYWKIALDWTPVVKDEEENESVEDSSDE